MKIQIPFLSKLLERRYTLADMDKAMDLLVDGRATSTGTKVNNYTALNCVPYFAGVRLISETVGQLPLHLYRRLSRGKARAVEHSLYNLLHNEPNPEMDAISFKESMQGQAINWGNAFAEIQWDMDSGEVKALWPLRSDRMQVGRENGNLIYVYRLPDGTTAKLPAFRVFHLAGFGFDGLIGYDPIYLAREALGMAMAMEEFGARFFANGANPGGVLEHPNKLSATAQDSLRKTWNEMHQGLSNQHRIAILEEGMKYHQVGIPPENAQFLESRKFQIVEIARLLHIPPHMLADLERATFSNIEHQGIEFVTYTMQPWLERWEQTISRKLLKPEEKKIHFAEFLVAALLRGDTPTRFNSYATARQWGWMSANDIRELENQNPLPGEEGDIYLVPMNMIPASQVGKVPPVEIKPEAKPAPVPTEQKVLLQDAIKRIAERERQNILRAAKKPETFAAWEVDCYRDFRDFIGRQLPGVEIAFIEKYITHSRGLLQDILPEKIQPLMLDWVDLKIKEMEPSNGK